MVARQGTQAPALMAPFSSEGAARLPLTAGFKFGARPLPHQASPGPLLPRVQHASQAAHAATINVVHRRRLCVMMQHVATPRC